MSQYLTITSAIEGPVPLAFRHLALRFLPVHRAILGAVNRRASDEVSPVYVPREQALGLLEAHLDGRDFLVGERYSIADIAVYGYVHVSGEAAIDLSDFPGIGRWIERIEATPGHVDDLVPIPADTRLGVGRSIYG